jgi:hypothetical protein
LNHEEGKMKAGPRENVWARKAVERQQEADPYSGVVGSMKSAPKPKPVAASSSSSSSSFSSSKSAPSKKSADDGKSRSEQKGLAERRSKLAVTNSAGHPHPPHAHGHDHREKPAEEDKGKEAAKGKKQKREEKKEQMAQAMVRQQEVLATYQRNLKASVESIMKETDELEFRYSLYTNPRPLHFIGMQF